MSDDGPETPLGSARCFGNTTLFQDVIDYYIVAFLGMATSGENPLTGFRRSGVTRSGLRDSQGQSWRGLSEDRALTS